MEKTAALTTRLYFPGFPVFPVIFLKFPFPGNFGRESRKIKFDYFHLISRFNFSFL